MEERVKEIWWRFSEHILHNLIQVLYMALKLSPSLWEETLGLWSQSHFGNG